jgi:glycosyltransferase involved in cell wall biosynthesis
MRIAFFHNLPSGGAKRAAYEFIKNLSDKHEIDLYHYDKHSEDFLDIRTLVRKAHLVEGGETTGSRGINRVLSMYRVRLASQEIANMINAGNYDLALVMQCKVSNSPFLLRYLRIPSLYYCHEPVAKILEPHYRIHEKKNLSTYLKSNFLSWSISIDRTNARQATLICANSLYSVENIYRNYGIYPRLNYLGVDTDHFRPLNMQRERSILCVGALNSAKGQDFLIQSVGTLTKPPPIRFIYNFAYGVDTYQKDLIELANKLGVSVSFDNLVTDDALVNAYNTSTLTAFPSLLEPLGLVPLESMACGTPVVGVAEAGIRETVVNEETGFLTARDPIEFGKAIERLINDKAVCSRMCASGRQKVIKSWTWKTATQQLELNIQKALEIYVNASE